MVFTPPDSVIDQFILAGWYPGRCNSGYQLSDHPGAAVLRQFEGLHVGGSDLGGGDSRADIEFRLLSRDHNSVVDEWERILDVTFIGVGEYHQGYCTLWVAHDGRFFGHAVVNDSFLFEGDTFDEAMACILVSGRSRPLIHPSKKKIEICGNKKKGNDPDIYDYRAVQVTRRHKKSRHKKHKR